MSHTVSTARPFARRLASKSLSLSGFVALLRSRQELAKLDASQLEDIGLSYAEARAEAARPVWDVPASWHRC